MQQTPVLIRKYANRRLYDTSSRRYVNLEDLAALVRKGVALRVEDAKTGEDVTRVVLTQIIVEDAKGQPAGLPVELLRELIVASDRTGREFVSWYLKSAFDAYHKVQETVQERFSDVRDAAFSPLHVVKSLLTPPGSPAAEKDSELEHLRGRVAELEEKLRNSGAHRKRTSRKIAGNGPRR
jgi:polyhydroxyalkanoate synthesis repressor PhaR